MRCFVNLSVECDQCGTQFIPGQIVQGEPRDCGDGKYAVSVAFDPRCPVCHALDDLFAAAEKVRKDMARGYTRG